VYPVGEYSAVDKVVRMLNVIYDAYDIVEEVANAVFDESLRIANRHLKITQKISLNVRKSVFISSVTPTYSGAKPYISSVYLGRLGEIIISPYTPSEAYVGSGVTMTDIDILPLVKMAKEGLLTSYDGEVVDKLASIESKLAEKAIVIVEEKPGKTIENLGDTIRMIDEELNTKIREIRRKNLHLQVHMTYLTDPAVFTINISTASTIPVIHYYHPENGVAPVSEVIVKMANLIVEQIVKYSEALW